MKVLTIGGAMIDTIAIIDSNRIERMTMSNADASYLLLAEGHKTEASEVSTHCGGGAINTAVACARLGCDVAAIVKLGQDARAETIIARLMSEGVSPRWVVRDQRATTGASVMVSSHERNAAIFTYRGANALLEHADLRDDAFAVDLVYVASLSNRSADCFPEIVAKARAHGAFVATNPGIRQLSSRGGALTECMDRIDLFALNRGEADVLAPLLVADVGEGGPPVSATNPHQLPELARRGLIGGGYELSLKAYFRAILARGVRYVVVTDGRNGAFMADRDAIYSCPTLEGDVAGTAGAGDAYLSTLALMLARGNAPDEALRLAATNAASVVAHVDTQTGLLTGEDLEARAQAVAAKLQVTKWEF